MSLPNSSLDGNPSVDPNRTLDQPTSPSQTQTIDISRLEHRTAVAQTDLPNPLADAPIIPGYHITAEIARGGMGCFYAGFDLSLDREVVIKTLLPNANAERFVTEAKITARLPPPTFRPFMPWEVSRVHCGWP
jgi:hypothetical protein